MRCESPDPSTDELPTSKTSKWRDAAYLLALLSVLIFGQRFTLFRRLTNLLLSPPPPPPWLVAACWCVLVAALFWRIYKVVLWTGRAAGAGRLLVDASQKPANLKIFLLLLAGAVAVAVQLHVSQALYTMFIATTWILIVLDVATSSRLEFRESGIFNGTSAIPWDKIDSWRWWGTKLFIQRRKSLFGRQVSVEVPSSLRDAVTDLLQRKLPTSGQ